MTRTAAVALAVSLVLFACGATQTDEPAQVAALERPAGSSEFRPLLDESSLQAWREHVLPDGAELAYLSIPWHPSFGAGMAAANTAGKPMLMWAMNGHPLGCT